MTARSLWLALPLLLAATSANADDPPIVFDPSSPECPAPYFEDEEIFLEVVCDVVNGEPVYGLYSAIVRHHYTWYPSPTISGIECYMVETLEPIQESLDCP